MDEADRGRWRVIYFVLAFTVLATVADIATHYDVPAEFYPFAGIVIGAALARIGGVNDVRHPRD